LEARRNSLAEVEASSSAAVAAVAAAASAGTDVPAGLVGAGPGLVLVPELVPGPEL